MAKLKNAAIYTRISRDAEGEGTGVERQEVLCRELAERLNLDVVKVYSDNDIGASDRTSKAKVREQFKQLLDDARAGEFAHILAYSNSRLTRRMLELEDLIKLYEDTGVVIRTVVSGQDDLSTSDGRMVARIKASVDAAESDRISERQKAAFRHRALQGKPKLQRQRPFGWEKDGVTLRSAEADLIKEAVQKVIDGKSITAIASEWEEAGVLTAAGNTTWEWSVLRKILVGWRTAGVRTYKREPLYDADGKLVMGTWEPIITLEQRDAALASLGRRSLKKVRQGTWLLTGLVRCGECGMMLYGQIGATDALTTYTCKNRGHNVITAHKLEWITLSAVFTHMRERAEREAEGSPGITVESEVEEFPHEARLGEIGEKVSELMDAYNAGHLSGDIVFPQVDKLDRERKDLRIAREAFYATHENALLELESSEEVWATIGDDLFNQSPDDQRLVIQRELEAVVVRRGKRGRAGWGMDNLLARLSFEWKDGSTTPAPTVIRSIEQLPTDDYEPDE